MSRPGSLPKLEEDAYYAVLRALAVNDLDWDKEKLLTDLRKILNITNDQHFKFLEEVTEDKLVSRLREARSNPGVEEPVPASYTMPPPRQNPNNINRKSSRPTSGGLKITPSPTAGPRPSRPSESSAELKRSKSNKRDRDEVFEPRKSLGNSGSRIRASLGGRGRGRGRRIPGFPRELPQVQTLQVLSKKFKRIPFDPDHFRERLENGSPDELEDMNAALLMRSQAIQKHLDLIKELEDDLLASTDPLKHCHLLIQELELTEIKINSELEALKSDEEDSL